MVISDNMTIQNFILVMCPAVCVLLFFLNQMQSNIISASRDTSCKLRLRNYFLFL